MSAFVAICKELNVSSKNQYHNFTGQKLKKAFDEVESGGRGKLYTEVYGIYIQNSKVNTKNVRFR
jgi:hypothetical protein